VKQAFEGVGDKNMIVMAPKETRSTITVFTDVDCPYCARLHQDVPELNRNGIKVRYLLYPRAGEGSKTYRRSVAVWCAPDRIKAVGIAKNGGQLEMRTCANPVDDHYRLGERLGISGTPTIFLENGKKIPGYVPASQLIAIVREQGGIAKVR
jgi:thiol:disulfide interchange protein DsbC